MIKIKLYDSHTHRNETTFRPFLLAKDYFREIGIEFTDSDDYDYGFVGQASIIDKKKHLIFVIFYTDRLCLQSKH